MTQLQTRSTATVTTVGELAAGDVVLLEGTEHPAVVEALSDVAGPIRSLELTHLRFGTSTGRLVLPADAAVTRLDATVWWHVHTNVSEIPRIAWVRGRQVEVAPGRSVAVVDTEVRRELTGPGWEHTRLSIRTDRLRVPGWQTLRAGPAA